MNATTNSDHGSPLVLLMEPDDADRERYGAWLENAGLTPITCPGPRFPAFTCLGMCSRRCPLAEVADVAVLDARHLPGISKKGQPAWRLLRYYLASGKPVVVIADHYRKDRTFRPEQVAILRPDPGPQSLLLLVKMMLREAQKW